MEWLKPCFIDILLDQDQSLPMFYNRFYVWFKRDLHGLFTTLPSEIKANLMMFWPFKLILSISVSVP